MTYYFVGGEDHDFTKIGACSVDTATTAARRTSNARCALKVGGSAAITDGWHGTLSATTSSLWISAMIYKSTQGNNSYELFSLLDGTVRRIVIRLNSSAKYELCKRNAAGTTTLLATSAVSSSSGALEKLDVHVTYGVSGGIDVYIGGTLIISYSGDVTTDSATTLSGFALGCQASGSTPAAYWSEVVCASEDTRAMSVVTLPVAANGNAYTFDTGSFADVDEVTLSDSDLITSATAGQLAQFTVSSSGITGTPAIRAVCISVRAQKGGSGPQNAKLNVRTAGADNFSASAPLPVAMSRFAHIFETNPATSGPWGYTDLTAAGFNIGIRSET